MHLMWPKQAQLEEATELVNKLEAELMEERETRMLVEKGFIRATALRFFNPNVEGTWPCDAIAHLGGCFQPARSYGLWSWFYDSLLLSWICHCLQPSSLRCQM